MRVNFRPRISAGAALVAPCEHRGRQGLRTHVYAVAILLAIVFGPVCGARANLVQDGNFTSVTYTGALPLTTATYGEFGSGYAGATPTPTLTVAGWSSAGYNYVYAPNTADSGSTSGMNAGAPYQAPGQFNIASGSAAGYGNTFLWGSNNKGAGTMSSGGTGTVDAVPGGGNFVALDGVYEVSPISQTITGLTVGQIYVLKFWWAGAQQQSFTGPTTEWLVVNMGGTFTGTGGGTGGYFTNGQTFTTSTISLPTTAFSGWYQQTMYFTASTSSETLSFLAGGTPSGEPPFSLVGSVDLETIPDVSNWLVFTGFGVLCILIEVMRRRRSRLALATAAQSSGLCG